MLTFGLTKKSNRMNANSMENNMASGKHYIECISKSFENKGYIKPKVVLWKCYVGFPIWFYLEKLRIRGGIAHSDQPELTASPEIGNGASALVAITMIAQCQMKNTRSDRFKP